MAMLLAAGCGVWSGTTSWCNVFYVNFREERTPPQDCSFSPQTLFSIIGLTLIVLGPVYLLPVYKEKEKALP